MVKYYCFANFDRLDTSIANYRAKCKELNRNDVKFVYLFEEEDLNSGIANKVEDIYKRLKDIIDENNIIISFRHTISKEIDNNQTCKKLYELTQKFPNINVGIEDNSKTWNVYDIIKANQRLDDIAYKIKKANLSPAEQLLMAYFEVTNLQYIEEGKDENWADSRAIYSILNSGKIVCVGFVELLKEILTRVNSDNIEIFRNIIKMKDGGHQTAIVYLEDSKYQIQGYYYLDPTWDARNDLKSPREFGLAWFLVPFEQLKYIKSDRQVDNRGSACKFVKYTMGDFGTTIVYNFIEEARCSVAYRGAKVTPEMAISMIKHCKNLVSKYRIESLYTGEFDDEARKKKVMDELISDESRAFDALNDQSKPIKTVDLVKIILNVLKAEDFEKDEAILRVKRILRNNIKLVNLKYEENYISCLSYKNVKEFCEKNPQFNIFKNADEKETNRKTQRSKTIESPYVNYMMNF